jgi:flagellar biosynthetic protein FliR
MERLLEFSQGELLRFLLIVCRVSPLMMIAPFWGSPLVPGQVRIYLALLVSALLMPVVRAPIPPDAAASLITLFFSVASELLLGFIFAYMAVLLFAAVQMAGQLVDIQVGFGIANVFDPVSGAQVTLIGQVLYMAAIFVFILLNGHHMMLKGLADSFTIAPPGRPFTGMGPVQLLVERGGSLMFILAAQVAAPAMTALFLVNLAMGLVSRVLPQINIFLVGLPLNVGIGLLVLAASMSIFPSVMRYAISGLAGQLTALTGALR